MNFPALEFCTNGTFTSCFLVWCCGTQGCINCGEMFYIVSILFLFYAIFLATKFIVFIFFSLTCKTHHLPFRNHWLDVSATILRKDHTATSTLSISFLTRKLNQIRIDWRCVCIKHKFLGHVRNIRGIFLILVVFIGLVLLVLFLLIILVIILTFVLLIIYLWWWRRWRRGGASFLRPWEFERKFRVVQLRALPPILNHRC